MTPARMADPVIEALQDKVEFDPSPPPLPDRFPHRHGATVVIRTRDGREFSSTCKSPRGSGPRGVDWSDIDEKYRQLVPLGGLPAARVAASLECIRRFEQPGSVTELAQLLRVS